MSITVVILKGEGRERDVLLSQKNNPRRRDREEGGEGEGDWKAKAGANFKFQKEFKNFHLPPETFNI